MRTPIERIPDNPARNLLKLATILHSYERRAARFSFVVSLGLAGNVAATVTPQHLLLNRNAIIQRGLQPHFYVSQFLSEKVFYLCWIFNEISTKTKTRTSYENKNQDQGCYEREQKKVPWSSREKSQRSAVALPLYAQVFEEASFPTIVPLNGLPANKKTVTLVKRPWCVRTAYSFDSGTVVPIFAGKTIQWSVDSVINGEDSCEKKNELESLQV
ncbi:dihydroorotase, mitochondrial-like [Selaginella moellendorffii]|uniref:dihydroorotase, mitochondrial-like n=1 Tax=Selaginella moellendorffii TaxID=88036 RepID=UPI000D1C44A3|nr:dihydroorotase, mitochondrial-like [Selaginella moellendorffii]|eukprot:XP_024526960.1 dihydroorotase, mitochondrial-like [Selaginella moellendorffii]